MSELLQCQKQLKLQQVDVKRLQEESKNTEQELVNINKKIMEQQEIKKQLRMFEVTIQNQELTLKKRHDGVKDSVA